MSFTIKVDIDARDLTMGFKELERQIPFATALALTRTAQHAQAELKRGLEKDFTVRSKWVARGIRINPANKRGLAAEVGSRDQFMARQVTGGVKRGEGGKAIAIPGDARPSPKKVTRPSRWPGALLKKSSKFFIGNPKGHPDLPVGVYRRLGGKGRYKSGKKKGQYKGAIRLMWTIKESVTIAPRWRFQTTVDDAVKEIFQAELEKAMEKAISTAKRSG